VNWIGFEVVRQEAADRAMSRYRARQTREQRRFGRGTRILSREEALSRIARTHPRSAWRILQGYGLGNRNPVPERRGR
jgi:hypothetical protein